MNSTIPQPAPGWAGPSFRVPLLEGHDGERASGESR